MRSIYITGFHGQSNALPGQVPVNGTLRLQPGKQGITGLGLAFPHEPQRLCRGQYGLSLTAGQPGPRRVTTQFRVVAVCGTVLQQRLPAPLLTQCFQPGRAQTRRKRPVLIGLEKGRHLLRGRRGPTVPQVFVLPVRKQGVVTQLGTQRIKAIDPAQPNAQFYARADNLADWLAIVEKRLGSLSQRLSASAGQRRFNTDLAGETEARQSTGVAQEVVVKTPWMEIDDVFYETRGTTWALIHFLKALEVDFADVLAKKNATASFRQIIRELEATQEPLRSPMVLNGSKFGALANHSLVMANYVARANAAIIDLRFLLSDG